MEEFVREELVFPVQDRGPTDGDTVVLLHGFPQQSVSFEQVTSELHREGFRTLAPTQRGYATTNTPRRRRDYRTAELVADVVALLDAAGPRRVHLVGHDWGGAVAWAMAAWHPDRLHTLTIVSTPHPAALRASLLHSDQLRRSWYMGFFQLPVLPELIVPRIFRRSLTSSGLPREFVDNYCAAMDQHITGPLNWYRAIPFSSRPAVGEVTVPTTFVWGRDDFALGRKAAELTAKHVRAGYEFCEVAGGHWLPETHPAELTAAILRRIRSVDN